jgi:mRNA interferase MazF
MGGGGWARSVRGVRPRRGRRASLNRGSIHDVELPAGARPAVILTRDSAIPILSAITVAAITGTIRDLPTEVPVGREHGLARDSVVNCDNLFTIPKAALGRRRGELGPEELELLRRALVTALGLD